MVDWILTRLPLKPSDGPRGYAVPFRLIVDDPYAIPDALRGLRDPKTGQFVIEFRYMDGNEPAVRADDLEPGISVEIGKHSNRIMRLAISPEKAAAVDNVEFVLGMLERAFSDLQTGSARDGPNAKALDHAIRQRRERLRDQLLAGA